MEWRPIRGHLNALDCADEIAGLYFQDGQSHHHFCLDRVGTDGFLGVGDVHAARAIEPDPTDSPEPSHSYVIRLTL
jgi:hypothetical protein